MTISIKYEYIYLCIYDLNYSCHVIKNKKIFILETLCHSRVAGRTRETRGKRNNGILITEHRIHYHIDEMTDKDSGKTQGLWTHNIIKGNSIRWGANQTQMGMNELTTGNRKDHIRVWKHKEKEDKVWHSYFVLLSIPHRKISLLFCMYYSCNIFWFN